MQVLPSEKGAIACREYHLCVIIYGVSLKEMEGLGVLNTLI